MREWREVLLRSLLWLILGGWFGAWVLFAIVVAPTAFRVLPSAAVAGDLVGSVLGWLHLYGVAAGVILAVLAKLLGRRPWLWILPLLLALVCFTSHFGVTAVLAEVRPRDFGSSTEGYAAARFAHLHRLSLGLYTLVGVGVAGLLAVHVRADVGALREVGKD